jgi:hypothetical protein
VDAQNAPTGACKTAPNQNAVSHTVWALKALFESDFADHLVFKGGTSLSKAYQAIGRFSEDVDLTYDIRAIAPDLAPDSAHGDSSDSKPRAALDEDHSRTLGSVGE